jgi:MvaI/BcnI restriction endonuclease family
MADLSIDSITSKLDNMKLTDVDSIKNLIKTRFDERLRNQRFDISTKTHGGSEGTWVESQFKIDTNSNTYADFHGFEIKKDAPKITFGDWSADEYIFSPKDILSNFNKDINITKTEFLELFGHYNILKKRYSWSGSTCPSKHNEWTNSGQIMLTNKANDIFIIYNYKKDNRKRVDIPDNIKSAEFVILAYWSFESLDSKISKKFNNLGTVIIKKNKTGEYIGLQFCSRIDIDIFIRELKKGVIMFDSGMYDGNSRNYSQFRSPKSFWNAITIEEY